MSSFDEETKDLNYKPFLVIDEEPELKTDIEFNDYETKDFCVKILVRLMQGNKIRTIIALSFSFLNIIVIYIPEVFSICGFFPVFGLFCFVFLGSLVQGYILVKIILKTNVLKYSRLIHIHLGKKMGIFADISVIIHHIFKTILFQYLLFGTLLNTFILFFNPEKIDTTVISIIGSNAVVLLLAKIKNSFLPQTLGRTIIIIGMAVIFLFISFNFNCQASKEMLFYCYEKDFIYYFYCFGIINCIFSSHFELFDYLSLFSFRTSKRTTSVFMWSKFGQFTLAASILIFSFLFAGRFSNLFSILLIFNNTFGKIIKAILFLILIILNCSEISSVTESILNILPECKKLKFLQELSIQIATLMICDFFIYLRMNTISIIGILGGILSFLNFYFFPTKLYSRIFQERDWKFYLSHILSYINFITIAPLTFICVCNILHINLFNP